MGDEAKRVAIPIIQSLRKSGLRIEWDYAARSLKAQMRRAGRTGAEKVVIIGDEEVAKGIVQVRDMKTGVQNEVKIEDFKTGDPLR